MRVSREHHVRLTWPLPPRKQLSPTEMESRQTLTWRVPLSALQPAVQAVLETHQDQDLFSTEGIGEFSGSWGAASSGRAWFMGVECSLSLYAYWDADAQEARLGFYLWVDWGWTDQCGGGDGEARTGEVTGVLKEEAKGREVRVEVTGMVCGVVKAARVRHSQLLARCAPHTPLHLRLLLVQLLGLWAMKIPTTCPNQRISVLALQGTPTAHGGGWISLSSLSPLHLTAGWVAS